MDKEQIGKIIYEWVKKNFGESEADDPSWNIEALAKEISYRANEQDHDIVCDKVLNKFKEIEQDYRNDIKQGNYDTHSYMEMNTYSEIVEFVCSRHPDEFGKAFKVLATMDDPLQYIYDRYMSMEDHTWDDFRDILSWLKGGEL